MFTGIIEEVGKIGSLRIAGKTAVIEIEAEKVSEGLQLGRQCICKWSLPHRPAKDHPFISG